MDIPPTGSTRPAHKRNTGGAAPPDWSLRPLREIAPLQRGFDLPTSQIHSGPHPVVYSNGVLQSHERAMVKGPGVITGRSGTIGKVHFIEKDYWPHNTALWVTSFCGNDPKFIYYLYTHIDFARFLAGSGVPTLNRNDIHQHLALSPPLPEQRAIAEALSDIDESLVGLENLITKKRSVKQAAIQQLLTGKIRLPGFNGDWKMTRLGELADIENGATPSTRIAAYWNGQIPWCTPTDITDTAGKYLLATKRNITEEGLSSCTASLLPAGTLLLCSRATIGEVKIATSPICTNQGFKSLVCKDGVSNEFMYYLVLILKPKMIERAIGSTFLEIGKREVASLEVKLPPHDEQCEIAAVLSDMDTEIATLQRRRDKTRALKQGMMQQLLTGRIRLLMTE